MKYGKRFGGSNEGEDCQEILKKKWYMPTVDHGCVHREYIICVVALFVFPKIRFFGRKMESFSSVRESTEKDGREHLYVGMPS